MKPLSFVANAGDLARICAVLHPSELTAMKCPYCGDETKQRDWGEIKHKQTAVKMPSPILYRCGNCAFIYAVPRLENDNQQDP